MGQGCASPQAASPHEKEAQQHLDLHFEESQVTKRLAAILKETNQEIYKLPTKQPFIVNLGMIMLQCKQEGRYKRPPASDAKFADTVVLNRAARYLKYAAAAYASSCEDITKVIQGDEEGDAAANFELQHSFRSDQPQACPSFFIAADKKTGDTILSISGGPSIEDAMSMAANQTTQFMGGYANEHILEASKKVLMHAKVPLENALGVSQTPSLAIVGHSTGGGAAILAMLQNCDSTVVEGLLAKGKVKCFAYGSPPVFVPGEQPLPATTTNNIFCFVNGMDVIPRVCLGTVGKLLMAVRQADELDMSCPDRLKFLSGEAPLEQQLSDCVDLTEELDKELKMLPPVGIAILLRLGKDGYMCCQKLLPEHLDRIMIHENMFKDHSLGAYEESIEETTMQLQRQKGCC